MALNMEQIRQTADRVAASQGLEIVEIEYLGGSKHRVLRVFIERNAEQRARRAENLSSGWPREMKRPQRDLSAATCAEDGPRGSCSEHRHQLLRIQPGIPMPATSLTLSCLILSRS